MIDYRARVGDTDEARMLVLPVTLRAKTADDDGDVLEGLAAQFNTWTQIGDPEWGFMESIAPGAFTRSIQDDDIRSFFNHDSNIVLGRTSAKTAAFVEDDIGLRAVIRPPGTAAARDVITLIRRGDVTGMSFMFRTRKDQWEEPATKGALPKRTLMDVQLYEAGPVTFPAYESTSIHAREQSMACRDGRPVDPGLLTRRKEADRLMFELAVAAVEL